MYCIKCDRPIRVFKKQMCEDCYEGHSEYDKIQQKGGIIEFNYLKQILERDCREDMYQSKLLNYRFNKKYLSFQQADSESEDEKYDNEVEVSYKLKLRYRGYSTIVKMYPESCAEWEYKVPTSFRKMIKDHNSRATLFSTLGEKSEEQVIH